MLEAPMKVCVAQTRPLRGDVAGNIERHVQFITSAASHEAEVIVFPELSLTGYEPDLAGELAATADDPRFDAIQTISDRERITVGAGVPIRSEFGIHIGMVLFQPRAPRQVYSKQYIHADEEPFFVAGNNGSMDFPGLVLSHHRLALAICYELSVPEHAAQAFQCGATMYVASVAKTSGQLIGAIDRLSQIARTYSSPVLMSNCVGPCGDIENGGVKCGGRSSIWNERGQLRGQLDDSSEGLLILDTESGEVRERRG
jgi:predicted amidohydrolase